jgi:N-acetylmuramoyl-L-alanine amidase
MLDAKGKIMSAILAGFLFLAPALEGATPPLIRAGWAWQEKVSAEERAEGDPAILPEEQEEHEAAEALEAEPEKRYEPDDKERELLARAVYSEARGEIFEGQVAVAAVILNRLEDQAFPNTIAGVIFQPRAFTAVADGQFWYTPNETSFKAVEAALEGKDPSEGALFYYNPVRARSRWIFTRPVIKRIGRHLFAN